MNRPARLLIAVFIDLPARIIDGTLNRLMPDVDNLTAENQALKADRDRLNAIANQLATANTDMAATIREMVTLDDISDDDSDDDDLTALADIVAESNVVHPSLIGPLCEEFGREIDARLDAVTEEWSA